MTQPASGDVALHSSWVQTYHFEGWSFTNDILVSVTADISIETGPIAAPSIGASSGGAAAVTAAFPTVLETTDAAGSSATTYTLGIGQTAHGTLSTGSDHDFYRVDLVAGQTYTFALTGTGTNNVVDPFLNLYASNGTTLLAQNDDGLPGGNSILTYTAASTGSYYLDAGSYANGFAGEYGLSATLGTRASFDVYMGAGVIDTDLSWSSTPGTSATVTYGFRQTTNGDSPNFSQLTGAEIAAAQLALQFWHDAAGISFTQVSPGGYTNSASILFSNYYSTTDGAGAYAYYPGSTSAASSAGDVWLNTDSVSTTSLPTGSYSFFAIMHEIGHALGLSHPGLYNAAPGVSITYSANAQFAQDTQQYTVMSYFDESSTGANFGGYADTPMLFDVYALQQIYGANTATRAGDTIYGFGSNAGSVFDFGLNPNAGVCIWDGGGTDTLNCSGFSQTQTIDLHAGTYSSLGGYSSNLAIAIGAVIENAVGGSGADTIIGNDANNRMTGGAGNDTLDGGLGVDTAVFSGLRSAYTVTNYGGGSAQVSGPDGTDTLSNFEYLAFSDQTMSLANTAPVATIGDHVLSAGQSAKVSTWITYADAENNPATYYQFYDGGTAANSGYFSNPGNAHYAAASLVTVAAADIGNTYVNAGSAAGTEALYVRAFDGTDWGGWDSFNLTTQVPNSPPVATIDNHTLSSGQSAQVSGWISYSDADGNPATYYQFYDSGIAANSGYLSNPGNAHYPAASLVTVAAADIASTYVHAGSAAGAETMYVRAFDGTDWGNWDAFNFTTQVVNTPPVATINDQSLAIGQSAQVSGWISYSDADSNPATYYQFYDSGIAVNSGYLSNPGNAHYPAASLVTVAAADIGNTYVNAGSVAGAETIYIRAFDGTDWGNWNPFNLTTHA